MSAASNTTPEAQGQTERTVLWIGTFYSQCGACGHNADPAEVAHEMKTMRGEGCGATYTHISSGYMNITPDMLSEMRPDLEVRS